MFSRVLVFTLFTVSLITSGGAAPVVDAEARSMESLELRALPFFGHLLHPQHKTKPDDLVKNATFPAPLPKSDKCPKKKRSFELERRSSGFKDASKGLTLYRPIASDKASKDKNVVGHHPADFEVKSGPLSSQGGYYMYSDINEAKWYGNALKTAKNTTGYSVVTLKWEPSKVPSFQLKEYKKADKEWTDFVLHNYAKNAPRISPDRSKKLYHMIVGPVPDKFEQKLHKFEVEHSNIDCKEVFQFAIVDKVALQGLNVTKVEDFKAKPTWTLHGGKEPSK